MLARGVTMVAVDPDQRPYPEIQPAPDGHAWFILHARPRAEKKIRDHYQREGWTIFLPLRCKEHRYGGRVRVFWSPLFAGYVFGCFPEKHRYKLKQDHHVANVLPVVDQATLVDQLQQIRQAVACGEMLEVMPGVKTGTRVRITAGPFKGVEGIVEKVEGKTRVIVGIEMIQQAVAIGVESQAVELV